MVTVGWLPGAIAAALPSSHRAAVALRAIATATDAEDDARRHDSYGFAARPLSR